MKGYHEIRTQISSGIENGRERWTPSSKARQRNREKNSSVKLGFELTYSSAFDIRPGTVWRGPSNEHTFMSIRDMTLFGAFTGGFRHYRGAIFIRGGDKSPLYRTQKRRFYNRIAVPKAKNIFGGLEKGKESHSAKFCFQGKFRIVPNCKNKPLLPLGSPIPKCPV